MTRCTNVEEVNRLRDRSTWRSVDSAYFHRRRPWCYVCNYSIFLHIFLGSLQLQKSFNNAVESTASSHIMEQTPMIATESESELHLITLSDLGLESNNIPSIIGK